MYSSRRVAHVFPDSSFFSQLSSTRSIKNSLGLCHLKLRRLTLIAQPPCSKKHHPLSLPVNLSVLSLPYNLPAGEESKVRGRVVKGCVGFCSEASPATGGCTATMIDATAGSVRQQVSRLLRESLHVSLQPVAELDPSVVDVEPLVAICNPRFGDYQCNNAMGIWSKIRGKPSSYRNPNSIGQAIVANLPASTLIESATVAGPGFVNLVLSTSYIAQRLDQMLIQGIGSWAPVLPIQRALVDFSSPNIAKEMHVGHLRSTIIGDSLARMLEYCHVEVLRRNHVGDWGTQFGMLIEYLFEEFPNWEEIGEQAIGDLQAFYKAAKQKFDADPAFKEKAQQAVVRLQRYHVAWESICDISRREFDLVYKRLNVTLEEKGESFYNPYIPAVLEKLSEKGLIEESDGAKVIRIEGVEYPLIVVKRDGGYNYASTDLAACWYRLNVERAEWLVYVTDIGQAQHFDMWFKAVKRAGWLPVNDNDYPKAKHVGFGLVLGADGKRFRTRSSEVVRLIELLDEAKSRSMQGLVERGREGEWTAEELEHAAEALGYGAIKYADLKNNRLTNYIFNFDQMLDVRGNTAVYLLYAHARIRSIIRRSGKNIEELKQIGTITLDHENERQLGLHLVQFAEIVEDALAEFYPNILCEYLYNLSEVFTKFYSNCTVIGSEQETSRLLICEATSTVMRECFKLLGITPLERL
ncbi:hypothetical protein O6H91_17G004800 [Diphasiastrum complanatum]|uniref:Uncharacterized protein n=1 Tax=Diphasiastrum complanatum TaxID=34168 RepID=A0ACC2B4T8_DIPCM|nr:hypothetical protein O6H91_17G004800 [Diphasiastrum complanatum]